jgi:hypothetical protein
MPRWLWLALLLSGGLLLWAASGGPPAAVADASRQGGIPCPLPPRFASPDEPLQTPVPPGLSPFSMDGARVTPLAGFSLQARILGREDYSLGSESRFSPTDLALGWGPMAAEGMADRLGVTQGSRWYRYRWGNEGPPLPPAIIARTSANMHLVPADAAVAAAIDRTRDGQVVRLQGWLVRIDDPSGWHWQSSLSRDDTGAGACELVLVCAID